MRNRLALAAETLLLRGLVWTGVRLLRVTDAVAARVVDRSVAIMAEIEIPYVNTNADKDMN